MLLTRIVDRLRLARFGRGVQVDDGWWPERDISVALGPWGWAHVQALVEDHGMGRCLFRARLQVRLRPGTVVVAALMVAAALLAVLNGADLLAAAIGFCAPALLVRVARDVLRDTRQIFEVVAAVAGDYGMHGLGDEADPRWARAAVSWGRRPERPEPTQGG